MHSPIQQADDVLVTVGPLLSHIRVISTNKGIQKKVCILCQFKLSAIQSVMNLVTHHPKTCQCIHQICNYRLGRWLQWDPFHHSCCGMLMPPNHLSQRANTSQTCCDLDSEGLGINRNSTCQGTYCQGCQECWMS